MDQQAINDLKQYPLATFSKGEQVLKFGEEARYVYFLVEGTCMRKITTSAGEELFFEEYYPDTTVNALVGPFVMYTPTNAINGNEMVALSAVRAHRLSADEFDAFLDAHPAVMKELLQRITSEYSMLMSNFISKQKGQAAPRVAGFILERAHKVGDKLVFSRFCSVSDIARFLGMHRITANKIVLALRNAGCITYNENVIEITDPELLEEYAQGNLKIDYKK
ncbi:MAG: Crp/Fnr family transcriptional regulator [Peptococcaceae bacterium]|nr:Crp/Fnr family transcriptional regulator [Peptococcaceae bacterium]